MCIKTYICARKHAHTLFCFSKINIKQVSKRGKLLTGINSTKMYFQCTSAQLLASEDGTEKYFYFLTKMLSSLDISHLVYAT